MGMKEELKILEEPVKKKLPACTVILYVLAAASLICAGFMLYYSCLLYTSPSPRD